MNYKTTSVTKKDGLTIAVKKKKNRYNIQISAKLLPMPEDIHSIIRQVNEESVNGSFYFSDGTLTFQMLLNDHLNEKSLKLKLNTAIAAFDSFLRLLEVKTSEKR